jgi:predicted transposase/invertase (TIGR01784 family)
MNSYSYVYRHHYLDARNRDKVRKLKYSPMKTDSLFYRLFSDSPELVFELIGETPPTTAYTFGSQEVKQTSFRLDGLMIPPERSPNAPIIFIEVMGYRDDTLYFRFFAEIFLYLKTFTPANNWRAVLLFSQQSLDPGLSIHFQDFDPNFRLRRIYLDQLPTETTNQSLELGILQLIGCQTQTTPQRARELIQRSHQEMTTAADQQRIVELILTILVYKFPTLSREDIQYMLGLDELKQTRFYQEVKQEGREEGKKIGEQRGRQQEAANLVLRLLVRRLNQELPEQTRSQIEFLTLIQLEQLTEALLDFTKLDDLLFWLEAH